MTEFGLLGRKLSHSHSPELHRMLGGYEYALIEKEPEELCGFFGDRNFKAINVTVPYKKAVIPYCDELSPTAAEIGSVNAIVNDGGRLIGYNTDYSGFMKLIESSGISVDGKKCLVLGNGGVAPTVRAALRDLNAASMRPPSECIRTTEKDLLISVAFINAPGFLTSYTIPSEPHFCVMRTVSASPQRTVFSCLQRRQPPQYGSLRELRFRRKSFRMHMAVCSAVCGTSCLSVCPAAAKRPRVQNYVNLQECGI